MQDTTGSTVAGPTPRYDVVVVGAGLIGLASARALIAQLPSLRIAVVDKEDVVAAHQSSHNSGVLHAGVYYKAGSLKARLCVQGKAAVERFAEESGIRFERCGKLIVAVHEGELSRLSALRDRAEANGVAGVRELGPEEVKEIEPNVVAVRALHVPGTAIIDFSQVARAVAAGLSQQGVDLILRTRVDRIEARGGEQLISTTTGDLRARFVLSCAGLHADRVARQHRPAARDLQIVPFRGDYYHLVPERRGIVRGLVYPVPDPALPFLGVHFTRRIDGEVWAGPNAVLAFAREGYRRADLDLRDLLETVRFPGFRRLSRRYWRLGMQEMWRDVVKSSFVAELQRYVPSVTRSDLAFGPSGVRAQAVALDGSLVEDFSIVEAENALHVRNAPSPGATASLAIGEHIADMVARRFTT